MNDVIRPSVIAFSCSFSSFCISGSLKTWLYIPSRMVSNIQYLDCSFRLVVRYPFSETCRGSHPTISHISSIPVGKVRNRFLQGVTQPEGEGGNR